MILIRRWFESSLMRPIAWISLPAVALLTKLTLLGPPSLVASVFSSALASQPCSGDLGWNEESEVHTGGFAAAQYP